MANTKLQRGKVRGKGLVPVGVTVVSPAYREVGREAVRRFRKYAGLEVVTIRCRDEEGFVTKLQLDRHPELKGRKVVYFDADWWLLRPVELGAMCEGVTSTGAVGGVLEPGCLAGGDAARRWSFPYVDCVSYAERGLRVDQYINTGFFLCDLGRAEHRGIFRRARVLWSRHRDGKMVPPVIDHGEQTIWNLARVESGVPLQRLPFAYNAYQYAVDGGTVAHMPRMVVGLHGAGIPPGRKLEEMKCQARVYGGTVDPMWEAVVRQSFALQYELQ